MTRVLRVALALVIASVSFFALYETIEAPSTQFFGHTIVAGTGHVVALTFDDGPNTLATPRVLDELERAHIHATFFVVGRAVIAHPRLVRRMWRDGDEIENHTQTHVHLNFLFTQRGLGREIDTTQAAVRSVTGHAPAFLRPPFGARDYAAVDAVRRRGMQVVMWSAMLPEEPARLPTSELALRLVRQVGDGAIIVIHDGDQGRGDVGGRAYESAATRAVIAGLQARGFRFVTIAQLALHA